jgi:hypothetical protein
MQTQLYEKYYERKNSHIGHINTVIGSFSKDEGTKNWGRGNLV